MSFKDNNKFVPARKVHFTYKEEMDKSSLCQGDILEITDELADVLKEVHPYFIGEQYKYFMVLSQSCDLVRRNGKTCKTQYITLAAVRNFDAFFRRFLIDGKYVEQIGDLLFLDEKQKLRAYQVIERLYNNNESEYFFLYKEENVGLPESMVAYLRVSIALKSGEHYDKCLKAKKLELSDEFKAKLGWLIGNMYSRVGTSDWEGIMSSQDKIDMINQEFSDRCIIGNREQLRLLKNQIKEEVPNHDDAVVMLADINVPTKYDKLIEILEEIIRTSSKEIPSEEKEKLLKTIKSRSALKVLFP